MLNLCNFSMILFVYYIGYTYLCSAVAEATKKTGLTTFSGYHPVIKILKIVQI